VRGNKLHRKSSYKPTKLQLNVNTLNQTIVAIMERLKAAQHRLNTLAESARLCNKWALLLSSRADQLPGRA
jgi:hypothetical protein